MYNRGNKMDLSLVSLSSIAKSQTIIQRTYQRISKNVFVIPIALRDKCTRERAHVRACVCVCACVHVLYALNLKNIYTFKQCASA